MREKSKEAITIGDVEIQKARKFWDSEASRATISWDVKFDVSPNPDKKLWLSEDWIWCVVFSFNMHSYGNGKQSGRN